MIEHADNLVKICKAEMASVVHSGTVGERPYLHLSDMLHPNLMQLMRRYVFANSIDRDLEVRETVSGGQKRVHLLAKTVSGEKLLEELKRRVPAGN